MPVWVSTHASNRFRVRTLAWHRMRIHASHFICVCDWAYASSLCANERVSARVDVDSVRGMYDLPKKRHEWHDGNQSGRQTDILLTESHAYIYICDAGWRVEKIEICTKIAYICFYVIQKYIIIFTGCSLNLCRSAQSTRFSFDGKYDTFCLTQTIWLNFQTCREHNASSQPISHLTEASRVPCTCLMNSPEGLRNLSERRNTLRACE